MRLFVFKCKSCGNIFACEDQPKQCPYCPSSKTEFIPNTTAEINDILYDEKPIAAQRMSYSDTVASLLELLSPATMWNNSTIKSSVSSSVYRRVVSATHMAMERISRFQVDPRFHNPIIKDNKDISYYELRVYGKHRSVCVATFSNYHKSRDSYKRMLKETTAVANSYLEHGLEYYLIPQSPTQNKLEVLLHETAKRLVGK